MVIEGGLWTLIQDWLELRGRTLDLAVAVGLRRRGRSCTFHTDQFLRGVRVKAPQIGAATVLISRNFHSIRASITFIASLAA